MQSFKRYTHSNSVRGSQLQKFIKNIILYYFRESTNGSHSQMPLNFDLEMSHRECPIGGYRTYGGVLWELLMFMQQARNFKFTIVHPPMNSNAWGGHCFDDKNCTGMAGIVNRQEADFALGKIQSKYGVP